MKQNINLKFCGEYKYYFHLESIILAGFPATVEYGSTSFTTTLPAPIIEWSPIKTSPIMTEFAPISTLSQIIGHLLFLFEFPIVVL